MPYPLPLTSSSAPTIEIFYISRVFCATLDTVNKRDNFSTLKSYKKQAKNVSNPKKEDNTVISVDLENNFLLYCTVFLYSRKDKQYFPGSQ